MSLQARAVHYLWLDAYAFRIYRVINMALSVIGDLIVCVKVEVKATAAAFLNPQISADFCTWCKK